MKLKIYTDDVLQQAVALATATQSQAQWLTAARENIIKLLAKKPSEYRSFGAFWWPLKQQLIDAELLDGTVNRERYEEIATGVDTLDMAGALLHHSHTANTLDTGNIFTVDTENGLVDYVLDDQEMEARIYSG